MDTNYDKFIRTTDDYHVKTVQKIFKKFYDQGDIYKGEYEGLYCVPCESFFTETQLVDGCCPDCGRPVKKTKEEAYFFKMSKYQDRLMKYIEDNPEFIQPESRKKEMINNFLKPGLQDLCVSRTSFTWGIPVTFDPSHVTYVWIDALSNYITALGYDTENKSELYNKYWPADVHIIGKDILRFHTIYWPIMLMALGEPLPKQIFGHPWLLSGMDKMSKSRGNVLYADALVERFGVDAMRYYLLSEMPYAQDGTISYETIISRYNSDLANTLGNLVNRTVAMVNKYFDGTLAPAECHEDIDNELISFAKNTLDTYKSQMDAFRLADATDTIISLAKRANKYIDETMPWSLAKDSEKTARLNTVLYNLIEAIRFTAVMLTPIMPSTAEAIFAQINTDKKDFDSICEFNTTAEHKVNNATPLFGRIDEEKMMAEINAENETEKEEPKEENFASIEDFAKLDICVAEIKEAEEIEGSDKLLKLLVDIGSETRQVVSGIKKAYSPADLIGKKVALIKNLKPVKLRGILSEGMILAAADKKNLSLLTTLADMPNGTKIS